MVSIFVIHISSMDPTEKIQWLYLDLKLNAHEAISGLPADQNFHFITISQIDAAEPNGSDLNHHCLR